MQTTARASVSSLVYDFVKKEYAMKEIRDLEKDEAALQQMLDAKR